jgi:hypothetical protein
MEIISSPDLGTSTFHPSHHHHHHQQQQSASMFNGFQNFQRSPKLTRNDLNP